MLVTAKDFKITVPALLFDPAFYPFDFGPKNELTRFLVVERSMLEQSPFIDIRFEPFAQAQFWVGTKELFALEDRHDIPRPAPVFIFHHAFVCSTLLARCLNQIDAFFSLKEPWLFRRMADFKRAQGPAVAGEGWREMFSKYVRLLCRNYPNGRIPVIKATNVANNLLTDVLQFLPRQQILYLYSDLEHFLISNLKKSPETQQKMPALARGFLADADFATRFPQMSDPSRFSFLEVCALIWLVSLYNLKHTVECSSNVQVRSMNAEDLLNDLPASLDALSRYFGHQPDARELQRMMDPGITQTNAKDPSVPYGIEKRQRETDQIRNRHGRELRHAIAWIDPLVSELGVLGFLHQCRLRG